MARLAFKTYGLLKADFDDPAVKGFVDRIADVFDVAEGAGGFIDHAGTGRADWGDRVVPRFSEGAMERTVGTLSIWQDIDAVSIYALQGVHSEALRRRHEWFPPADHPNHVAWWIADDHIPTWAEACERLEYLHDHGSTARAFSLRSPFDAEGRPTKLDPAKLNYYHKISKR